MPNVITTNIDLGSVEYSNMEFEDGVLAATGTVLAGTILARDGANFVPYAPGEDAPVPSAVLTYDITVTGTAAGRFGIAGNVRAQRLVLAADGDGSNITPEILDALRQTSIIPISVEQLGQYDNPAPTP